MNPTLLMTAFVIVGFVNSTAIAEDSERNRPIWKISCSSEGVQDQEVVTIRQTRRKND